MGILEIGWIKLNTDRAVSFDDHHATIGGVLRDDTVNWLWGFTMRYNHESIFKVEESAMLESLFPAWDQGYRKIELESDNSLLIELL